VGGHYHCPASQQPHDGLLDQVGAHVDVHCAENVIVEIYIALRVERSRKVNSESLPAAKIDAVLSNLSLTAFRKLRDIILKTCVPDGFLQSGFVFFKGKINIFLNSTR
jgi:hypothetical protein